jgi:hypothetical protein
MGKTDTANQDKKAILAPYMIETSPLKPSQGVSSTLYFLFLGDSRRSRQQWVSIR